MRMIQIAGPSAKRLAFGLGAGVDRGARDAVDPADSRRAPFKRKHRKSRLRNPLVKPDDASSTASPGKNKPATAKVEKGPFKVEVVLSGIFEAQRMTEVSIRPKAWAMPLVVERAIELGTPVKKGDILVEFDRDKIDKLIEDTEVENTISDLALKQAEEELPSGEGAARRPGRRHAGQDPGRRGPQEILRNRQARCRANRPVHGQAVRRIPGVLQGGAAPAREDVPLQGPDRGDRGDHPSPPAVPGRVQRAFTSRRRSCSATRS